MMERGKEEKNEKGEWRNEGHLLWIGSRSRKGESCVLVCG